eukprot:4991260-Pleurochrysis_carterae.AAC.1
MEPPPGLFRFLLVEAMSAARFSGERLPIPRGSSGEGFCPIPTALRIHSGGASDSRHLAGSYASFEI